MNAISATSRSARLAVLADTKFRKLDFHDFIAKVASGLAVRNDDHGLLRICGKEATIKFAFGFFVQRGTDFIQEHDGAWAQKATGNGDALRLPFA